MTIRASSPAARAAAARSAPPAADAAVALREKRYPPLRIANAVQTLVESGLNAQALLEGTGLDAAALGDPDVRVSSLQFLTVARNAVRLGCASDAGLSVGLRCHASYYGLLGYALLCSTTMRRAFDTTMRYYRVGSGMIDGRWIETTDTAVWIIPSADELPLPDLSPELYRFVLEMSMAAGLTVFKDVMGTWCIPARVAFMGPPPPHVDRLARAFECPLAFNQPRNELHYPRAWLERSPQLANSITAAQVSQACAQIIEEFKWQSGLSRRVYHELTCTPGRFPEIEEVASTLCMTSRTLRRKLEAEGTSYSSLLDSVRCALATDYLRTRLLGVDEVAALVGFSDTASFRRAFKRWTGSTPAESRG